jgi:hypothetical protein
MEAFKTLHKECEQLKTSGFSTAEIRRVKKKKYNIGLNLNDVRFSIFVLSYFGMF